MRILIVIQHFPLPARTGSAIVAFNHIKHLSKNHSLHIVCFEPEQITEGLEEYVDKLEFVPRPRRKALVSLPSYMLELLRGIPIFISKYRSRAMQQAITRAEQHQPCDVALLFEMGAIQHLPSSLYGKTIVNIEDPQSIRLQRLNKLSTLSFIDKSINFITAMAAARFERRFLAKMAKVLLLSESDRKDLATELRLTNSAYVPYGADKIAKEVIVPFEKRMPHSIVFSGTMSHPANVDAAIYFLKCIFPLIIDAHPEAMLWIVGANPDSRIIQAAIPFGRQVNITGTVKDVTAYLSKAMVSICPIRLKIGVQTKILEALSWGVPVVSTEIGVSGIKSESGKHLWASDNPKDFADYAVALLEGENWSHFSEAGKALVDDNYSWDNSGNTLEREISELHNRGTN